MTLEQTIIDQQKRINELEQQLVLAVETNMRIANKLAQLQEQVENLLDPIERIIHGEEPVQETPSNP